MRILIPILALTLTLTACAPTVVPVVPTPVEMPALPSPLNQRAQPLPPIVATDLHGLIREGAQTDRAYNDIRDRYNATIDAWNCVRTALNKSEDAKRCFTGAQ